MIDLLRLLGAEDPAPVTHDSFGPPPPPIPPPPNVDMRLIVSIPEQTLYVFDVDSACAVAGKVRKEVYGTARPQCASNLIGVTRLAQPEFLIEIAFRAVLSRTEASPTSGA